MASPDTDLVHITARERAWHSRNFRLLVAGGTINNLGGPITMVALAFAVLDLGGSATDLGLVVGAYALAEVVTTLFGGVLGDRVPRALMMQGAAAGSAAVQGIVAASLIGHWSSIPFLGVTGVAGGVVSALNGPSSSAMTPLTVPESVLSAAISIRRIASNAAQIIGFGIAGVLVAAYGSGWAIAIDALTYAAAALCFSFLRVPPLPPKPREPMLRDLGTGFREVRRHTWLWLLISQALAYHLFFGGVQGVLGPIVVGNQFGRAVWGWSLSALMVGFVGGGLLTLRWRPRRALGVGTVCLSLTAAFPLAIAFSPNAAGILVGAFLHGFGLEIFSVWWDLSIQQNVPADRLARVYSFDVVGSFVMRPVGMAVVGPLSALVGQHTWIIVVGAVMGCSSLLAATNRDVRSLVRRDEG